MRREAAVGERAERRQAEPAWLRGRQPGLTVLGSAGAVGKAKAATASSDDFVDVAGPRRPLWMLVMLPTGF